MLPFLLLAVFVGTFGSIVGAYVFLNRRVLARHYTARRRLQDRGPDLNTTISILRDTAASAIPALNKWLSELSHTDWLRRELRNAGMSRRPAEVILFAAVSGLATYLLATVFAGPILALGLGILVGSTPYLYLEWRKRRRRGQFEQQLPEAMDMLVNAMRAGYSFQTAVRFVGHELPAPLGLEFARLSEEQRLGVDARTALLNMVERVPGPDLKMFATAVLIQRETGGNLGEVLTNIAGMLRERFHIRSELQSVTAHARLSAKILGVLPVLVGVLIFVLNPEFARPLYTEQLGRNMLGFALLGQILGFAIMHRLADVEY